MNANTAYVLTNLIEAVAMVLIFGLIIWAIAKEE